MKKLLIALSILIFTTTAFAETATLTWDANTESDLAGYEIHWGTASGVYPNMADVGNVTSFVIESLQGGVEYFFAGKAYDTSGNRSGFSLEVSKIFIDTPPSTMKGLSIEQKQLTQIQKNTATALLKLASFNVTLGRIQRGMSGLEEIQ